MIKILIVIAISLIGIVIIGITALSMIEDFQDGDIICGVGGFILMLGIATGLFAMVFAIIKYMP